MLASTRTGTSTPSSAGRICYDLGSVRNSEATTSTISNGFTVNVVNHDGAHGDSQGAYFIANNSAALNPTWTQTGGASTSIGMAATIAAFKTANPDITPPTLTWIAPTPNVTVSSTITLTASSSDDVAVRNIVFSYGPFGVTLASSTPSLLPLQPQAVPLSFQPRGIPVPANGSTTLWASQRIHQQYDNRFHYCFINNPLIISGVTASTTVNAVTITWTTNNPASSTLNYGLTSSYGSSTTSSTSCHFSYHHSDRSRYVHHIPLSDRRRRYAGKCRDNERCDICHQSCWILAS